MDICRTMNFTLPANIPENYALEPIFENVVSEENLRNGIILDDSILNTRILNHDLIMRCRVN